MSLMQNTNGRPTSDYQYTHQLPYAVRRQIIDILDAQQSWRILGGQFMGLDAIQLALVGQAHMRQTTPTEELFNKLDTRNARIAELCSFLEQMNHRRAVEILRPYLVEDQSVDTMGSPYSHRYRSGSTAMQGNESTLITPTPSVMEHPAIMAPLNPFDDDPQLWANLNYDNNQEMDAESKLSIQPLRATVNQKPPQAEQQVVPKECHQSNPQAGDQSPIVHYSIENPDPGEEIVKMACAYNRKRTSISDQEVVNQLRLIMQITYNEIKLASNNFSDSNILGNGGFASVYRGNWKGTDVAIKRLKCNLMHQALNELTILNSYRIDNILPIYGISIDGPEACLVYQFMSNGSLEDRLSCKKNTPPLTWDQRAMIGEGVAKGLYYLHTLRGKPLVHGDVKSANILLDSQFVPKLGDFGLARQVFKTKNPQIESCTHCTVSSIHGTSVYLPPEYLRHKILSPAVDVYSYGIVLLEMATGRRAYDGKRLLIDTVEDETRSMSMGQIGYSLKDPRLVNDTQSDLRIWYELLIKLGLNCAHKIKKKRPDMGQVLHRFADYWTESKYAPDNRLGHNLVNNSNGCSTTARTLTPDLTTLNANQPAIKNNNASALNPPETNGQPNIVSLTLMSVEEENNDVQQNNDGKELDAMIPLLTELGLTGSNQQV